MGPLGEAAGSVRGQRWRAVTVGRSLRCDFHRPGFAAAGLLGAKKIPGATGKKTALSLGAAAGTTPAAILASSGPAQSQLPPPPGTEGWFLFLSLEAAALSLQNLQSFPCIHTGVASPGPRGLRS